MAKKKILVIGSGAREAAFVWALERRSSGVEIYCAPGNGGIAKAAKCFSVKADDFVGLRSLAWAIKPDLVLVGPEAPLVAGLADFFSEECIPIFGPIAAAAKLEGSKVFAKQFMRRHNIPTANFEVFHDFALAADYIRSQHRLLVIKADGLCGGKGVVVAENEKEALEAAEDMMVKKKFGDAGLSIVIEDRLVGRECSVIALVDIDYAMKLPTATDYKRRFDGDVGPNTGGMGCYSPVSAFTDAMDEVVTRSILNPVVQGMKEEGAPYRGFLYIGLMLTDDGPHVLEFNVRMGDPEASVILPRIKSDFAELLLSASCSGGLRDVDLEISEKAAVCVVATAANYPVGASSDCIITGIKEVEEGGAIVFHAGTRRLTTGEIMTAGGRVLDVVGLGNTLSEARIVAYDAMECISFDDISYRTDIASGL